MFIQITLTVQTEDGMVVASEEFYFDAGKEKMYLTVTEDGRIISETTAGFDR